MPFLHQRIRGDDRQARGMGGVDLAAAHGDGIPGATRHRNEALECGLRHAGREIPQAA